jgi:3-methyladenine DNA glycosylase AlkD
MPLADLQKDLKKLATKEKSKNLSRFFKTGKGEYGEGDIFLGVMVPQQREVAKKYPDLSLSDLQELLNSKIHEFRLTALFILVHQFSRASEVEKKKIVDFYLKNSRNINNWDLVDLSAPKILGPYLLDKERKILYKLVKSKLLWERRIAVLAAFAFIREHDFKDVINLAETLLKDSHDLMHKAVGWMLREVGKREEKVLVEFLDKYRKIMPRTMLRYAIEKFNPIIRQKYLSK